MTPGDEKHYEPVIRLFLLGHPALLRILDVLRSGEACVSHLPAALGVSQPCASQPLRVLREAGPISRRQEGLFAYYRPADPQVERPLAAVLGPATAEAPALQCPCPRCQETPLSESIFRVEVNRNHQVAPGSKAPRSVHSRPGPLSLLTPEVRPRKQRKSRLQPATCPGCGLTVWTHPETDCRMEHERSEEMTE